MFVSISPKKGCSKDVCAVNRWCRIPALAASRGCSSHRTNNQKRVKKEGNANSTHTYVRRKRKRMRTLVERGNL